MRYHLTLAIIQKPKNNKCWRGCREKGIILHCSWEWKYVQFTMENNMKDPQKTKNIIWFSNFDIVQTYIWTKFYSNRYVYPYVHSSTFYDSQDMEAV